ncbi:glutamyl-tRNA(Gln) amidotransferase subunit E [Methanolinea mesophila]|nr:glutamyl-tRNA(Gln) amidotransferase subunit E [Methanolinea mesophila]
MTDYESVGLKAGIEIHQQLNSREKLFCGCPTVLRKFDERSGEFARYLRATESEMGEIDRAAKEEMMVLRRFCYYAYDTCCLVEYDEEPPGPLNREALGICLSIAKTLGMTPIEQVHTMRKLVIDGSNTSGFQRTALVAMNGTLPNGGAIDTICLEEEAAQRVEGDIFSLDRLGIPLVEITTSPCMHTPEEVYQVAEYLGMVLRSTGRVKRGLGTIRQDVNISIREGARVEIKGVQELDLIAEVVRREVDRQQNLVWIREELRSRRARVDPVPVDVTTVFAGTASSILKKAKKILAVRLPGFGGLVGREIQPGRRLGSEISDYAKKCGVGGIFHTDELPAYGVTAEEVEALRRNLGAASDECIILVAAGADRAVCAADQVIYRANLALEGVPEETRKMLEGGSTAYMRPLPGAARMYPETDVLPVRIGTEDWDAVTVPELLTIRAERFVTEFGMDPGIARQVAYSEYLPLFQAALDHGIPPSLAHRTIFATAKEVGKETGKDTSGLLDPAVLIPVLEATQNGTIAKEAIPQVFMLELEGVPVNEAIARSKPSVSTSDIEEIVSKIVNERKDFVKSKGMASLGPLMGVVMEELRGAADGKVIAGVLKKEIQAALKEE